MIKLAVTAVWNTELTKWNISTAYKKFIEFIRSGRTWNAIRMDLILSEMIKIKSTFQARASRLWSAVLRVSTAILLRNLAKIQSVSMVQLLKRKATVNIPKGDREHHSSLLEQDAIPEIQAIQLTTPTGRPARPSNRPITNNKKVINFSEMLREEIEDDGLVKT